MDEPITPPFLRPPPTQAPDRELVGSTVLVTGAAGFLGSHFISKLANLGLVVRAVDCFTPYYEEERKKRNLEEAEAESINSHIEFIKADLSADNLSSIVHGVNVVVHLAAQPGVRRSWGPDFVTYIRHNLLATQRLMEALKDQSISYFLLASSSSIYGERDRMPVPEEAIPAPVSPYGCTKIACEDICLAYAANYNVPVGIVRYFTVYGPRQRPDMAFYKWIKAIASGEKLQVFGDGQQTRDFTYIDDAISGSIAAIRMGSAKRVYNIGGGENHSILDVINMLGKIMGKEPKVEFLQNAPGDVRHTMADITRANSELRYVPTIPLEAGLSAQVDWMSLEGII